MKTKFRPMIMNNWNAPAVGCSVSVYFGSIGTGPGAGGPEIERFLEHEPAVEFVQPHLRGREGETELCIVLRSDDDVGRVFEAINALIPRRQGGGWVSVSTKDGRHFSNYSEH